MLWAMCLAVVLAVSPAPAQAAEQQPLTVIRSVVTVTAPEPAPTTCYPGTSGSWCGEVIVGLDLAGVMGRGITEPEEFAGYVSGTARLTRVYGCADGAGKRLHRYDTRLRESIPLYAVRGMPYSVWPDRDVTHAVVAAFLGNAHPGNCPAGAVAMEYKIAVSHVRIHLDSQLEEIPSADYCLQHGPAAWRGAVRTPPPGA
jgi:hypothetical protein